MRNAVLLLFLLALAAAPAAAQSTKGVYQFTLGDDALKYFEFDAAKQADGSTLGSVYMTDDAVVTYHQDLDGTGEKPVTYNGFFIKAAADDIVVTKTQTGNQAVVSGTIRDSSVPELIGLRVLLTVEDNGDNTRILDNITWGVYNFIKRDWTPSDAEWKQDPGVGLRWWATDYERRDDVGFAMPQQDQPAGTQTYAGGSYTYADATRTSGDIVVTP